MTTLLLHWSARFGECLTRTGPAAGSRWVLRICRDNWDFQRVDTDDFQERLYLLIML